MLKEMGIEVRIFSSASLSLSLSSLFKGIM
jgi:hypothetical protein